MSKRGNKRNKGGSQRSVSGLIHEADRLFSILVRLRYLQFNNKVECYTCEKSFHFKGMECGHFIGRGHTLTRWLEENARPQCPKCNHNTGTKGEYEKFKTRLESDHEGLPEYLEGLQRTKDVNLSKTDLEKIIAHIKKRIDLFGGLKSVPQTYQ